MPVLLHVRGDAGQPGMSSMGITLQAGSPAIRRRLCVQTSPPVLEAEPSAWKACYFHLMACPELGCLWIQRAVSYYILHSSVLLISGNAEYVAFYSLKSIINQKTKPTLNMLPRPIENTIYVQSYKHTKIQILEMCKIHTHTHIPAGVFLQEQKGMSENPDFYLSLRNVL